MHARCATNALEILIDQHAQDLALRLLWHVGDFIEIKRTAMGFFKRTHFAGTAIRRLSAKQCFFHRLRRHRR